MKGDHIGEFEELVLLAVQGLAEDAYGVPIKLLLDRETARDVSIGAVYAALDRLEAKGLVTSRQTPGPRERGGRSRRSFLVTPDGRATLQTLRRVRERLWQGGRHPRPARSRS
jgi:DNA-binding PadR family transcriptional regulator